jgi:hypothetical protein
MLPRPYRANALKGECNMRRLKAKEKLLLSAIPDELQSRLVLDLVYANDNAFGDSEIIEIVDDFIDEVHKIVTAIVLKTL